MTDKPHSGESEYDDPLSLFAPEAAAPTLDDDDLPVDGGIYRASEHEGSAGHHFGVEHQATFRSVAASLPEPPFWRRHGSGPFAIVRLTMAIAAVIAMVFVTGWLLSSGSEPVHTAGDIPQPVPAPSEPGPTAVTTQPQVDLPTPRVEKPQRDDAPLTPPPARAAAEPVRTPEPEPIPRNPFNPPTGSRDPVTPAARVVLPSTPIVPPAASPPAASSSNTAAAPTAAAPADSTTTSSPAPVADSTAGTTLTPASPPPAVPAALAASSAPVVESETARAAPPTLPAPPVRSREDRIRSTITGYSNAVAQRSPTAVRAVWPSADVNRLKGAFDELQELTLQLEKCTTQPLGATNAVVTCSGTQRSVPKYGSKTPTVVRQSYEFRLREENDSWVIDRVITR